MQALAESIGLIIGIGFVLRLIGLCVTLRFFHAARRPAGLLPPVTLLKPLCGAEPLLEAALRSCLRQSYPHYQVVFGVSDPADPALEVVRRLAAEFPHVDIAVVADPTPHGVNRKISNLINMMPAARHDFLVLSDSDLHVAPDYLERLVAAHNVPGTGLVTTLSAGLPGHRGWVGLLGASQISHSFLPGALLARALGRQDCLGGTMALTRQVLQRIGGLQALAPHLADDNVLGQRVLALGMAVRIAGTVPATTVPERTLGALWSHELRWARTIRALVPFGFAASAVQFPLFWAMIGAVVTGGAGWSLGLLAGCWVLKAATVRLIDAELDRAGCAPRSRSPLWLPPLRDALSVVEIVASYFGDEVVWRGHRMRADDGVAPESGPGLIADAAAPPAFFTEEGVPSL
jgi:ceramide glucosyltransferase